MKKTWINHKALNYRKNKFRKIIARRSRLAKYNINNENIDLNCNYEKYTSNEKQNRLFKILFNLNPICTILSTFEHGIIIDANSAFYQITGYKNSEVIGKSSIDLGLWVRPKQREKIKKRLFENKEVSLFPGKIRIKNGEIRNVQFTAQLIESREETYWLSIIMDIESQKSLEATLSDRENQLEILSDKLHDLNIAIRVLGDAWGKEKTSIDNRLKNHLNANVFQFVEKIKNCKKYNEIQTYIKIIDNNLKELSVAISGNRQNFTETFTPLENQVFQLVRQGKSSKEIAELLNLSTKAISFHRSNIRKKLNLVNKKINLATYLRNQDAPL